MNTPAYSLFFQTILEDIKTHRPLTTEIEKDYLLKKAMKVFSSFVHVATYSIKESNATISQIMENFKKQQNKLFMFRSLTKESPLHVTIPDEYTIFSETSTDIYNNYLRTLDALENGVSDSEDINKFYNKCSHSLIKNVFSWSNTGILLNNILQKNDIKFNIKFDNIITYGSPVLVSYHCINIYHENDWILGFVSAYYKIDIEKLERNCIYEVYINDEVYDLLIASSDTFPNHNTDLEEEVTPHRSFIYFL